MMFKKIIVDTKVDKSGLENPGHNLYLIKISVKLIYT